ncbi:hypothetical protein [Limosilactobacillus sp.]|jgi:hypothetical protein|uniref:hypothetical protein n=1 Tax=Limosilactobacillus sp. TaxID=2773925 RepID=UPI0025C2DE8E|nr:hypothetical protein [Limosilactobacillus sp.]MCH3922614.1 hypothetical protein [Limosilactobacillus sp.]MCH3927297.1 hypothetical protein [Limosilactobacillus sp.]
MDNNQQRYLQPHSAQEAMEIIQRLFNKYRNAPLTNELLAYHNNLIYRLQSDIKEAAKKEGNPERLKEIDQMTDIMRSWTNLKLTGHPFYGKMRHFQLAVDDGPKFKRHVHRIHQTGGHRASRH